GAADDRDQIAAPPLLGRRGVVPALGVPRAPLRAPVALAQAGRDGRVILLDVLRRQPERQVQVGVAQDEAPALDAVLVVEVNEALLAIEIACPARQARVRRVLVAAPDGFGEAAVPPALVRIDVTVIAIEL